MTEDRILDAVERIDGALGRIEAAARRPAPLPTPGIDPAAFDALRERHATMRSRVQAAIAELDGLMQPDAVMQQTESQRELARG